MTQEHPELSKSYCTECQSPVKASKDDYGKLQIACACDSRSIRVAKATPQEWEL